MTLFLDGPAKGAHLMLRRAPKFLRVVTSGEDTLADLDALDRLDDTPEPHEQVHAYRRLGDRGALHIVGRRGRGGTFAVARYEYITPQPTDAELRDNESWRAWCEAQVAPVR